MGKTIATNGCFDLLHRGHLDLFEKMRQIVGEEGYVQVYINSDESFKLVKGREPINNQEDREFALRATRWVNDVYVFEGTHPWQVVEHCKPDIYCKGGDYQISKMQTRHVVRKYGGVVIVIDYLEGYSTSNLIKKIKEM